MTEAAYILKSSLAPSSRVLGDPAFCAEEAGNIQGQITDCASCQCGRCWYGLAHWQEGQDIACHAREGLDCLVFENVPQLRRDVETWCALLWVWVCTATPARGRMFDATSYSGHFAAYPLGSDTPGVPCAWTSKYSRALASQFLLVGMLKAPSGTRFGFRSWGWVLIVSEDVKGTLWCLVWGRRFGDWE